MIQAYRLAFTDSIATAFRPRGAPGRWNSKGTVVVYTAEHPALAALEMLTAWDVYVDFGRYHLYLCEIDEHAIQDAIPDVRDSRLDIHDVEATREYGDAWVLARRSVALRVPSVVSAASYNYLLDPDHPDFDTSTRRIHLGPYRYDARLLELIERAKMNP